MRLKSPRIAPLAPSEWSEEQREALKAFTANGARPLNIFATLVRSPKALTRFNEWGGYVLSRRNALPVREREIVILRIGFLCKSGYEFTQHTRIGLQSGLTEAEIEAIKRGADAGSWSPADQALLRMADDLIGQHFVSTKTWSALREHFDEKQCMDAVFTAGQYTQVSMFLNTFGVQLDPGQKLDPELAAYEE